MIRFNCPNCSRFYELPDALHRLPLLCKGCGQPLEVPAPSTEPWPETPVVTRAESAAGADTAYPIVNVPVSPVAREYRTETKPDFQVTVTPPVLAPMPLASMDADDEELLRQKLPITAVAVQPPVVAERTKSLPLILDIAITLVLIVVGALLGELFSRESTDELLRNALTAPQFPPTELVLWFAPIAILCLGYWALVSRHWSIGHWIERRRARRT